MMTNMIDEIPWGYWNIETTAGRIWHQLPWRAAQMTERLSKSLNELCWGLSCCNILLSYKSNIAVSWMHLHHCWFFDVHCCKAVTVTGSTVHSIWDACKHLELYRSTGKVKQSIWEVGIWVLDRFILCRLARWLPLSLHSIWWMPFDCGCKICISNDSNVGFIL